MPDSPDANLQLKKRARRRLVGAVAFAGLAAVVLPMVMDEEPKQQVQDVRVIIPGQNQAPPFRPALKPEAKPAPAPAPAVAPRPAPPPAAKPPEKPPEKPVEKPPEKPVEKPAAKPAEKPAAKAPEKPQEKPAEKLTDAQRAAAILAGRSVDAPAPSAKASGGGFAILIGAYSDPANVRNLQKKIGELGLKVYTEPLDSPLGNKTRVRAGPFPTRAAAEKGLAKLKRIGVTGVIAARP
ncbi:MAG: SPOR domain-containing protein [Candidatus Accumulibacter sp.]|jgi:DedD protein|nr:SPOR domain-containing protein [Accumulibacter sp.]